MRFLPFLLILFLASCAWKTDLYQVNPGDTKTKVVEKLGEPNRASGDTTAEYLWYVSISDFWKKHFIRLEHGKVESYGTVGLKGPEKP